MNNFKCCDSICKDLKIFFLGIFCLCMNYSFSYAQWATVSAGGNDTVGALVMSSSVGEVMVHEMGGGGLVTFPKFRTD